MRASKAPGQSDTRSISESGDNDDTEYSADALEFVDERSYQDQIHLDWRALKDRAHKISKFK